MNIVIIDTGITLDSIPKNIKKIRGIFIKENNGNVCFYDDFNDSIGHGTIVANILAEHLNVEANVFVIKIFDASMHVNMNLLVEALKYCNSFLDCDLIQISLGTLYSNNSLKREIEKLAQKGVIIISAFDNDKSISYPAAYSDVIGVDTTLKYNKIDHYDIVENDIIDIRGADIYHRTNGMCNKRTIVRGSSFYCSYITATIANMYSEALDKKTVLEKLKVSARQVYGGQNNNIYNKELRINKAIVFPINKETSSMAAFEHLLQFNVVNYYDLRQKGLINKQINHVLHYANNNKLIYDFNNIDWGGEFDTFVCGHVGEISKIIGYDILSIIVEKCNAHHKQLISFDDLSKYLIDYPNINAWFPYIDKKSVPLNRFGKLRSPNTPIVGVFGTSSRQGKMTIQLKLRESLMKKGIRVKNIGSEPESLLFGFESLYCFGYNSVNLLKPHEMIQVLNEEVFKLECDDCEIIIAGSQSGTVPHQLRNLDMIPLQQYYFLLGVQPDSIILCVNSFDSFSYINRTILMFESAVGAKVICLVVSNINSSKVQSEKRGLNDIQKRFGIPAFDLEALDTKELTECVLNYYNYCDDCKKHETSKLLCKEELKTLL